MTGGRRGLPRGDAAPAVGVATGIECGRPYRRGGEAITSAPVEGDGWATPSGTSVPADPEDRRAAAARWTADALAEHASIAAFARLTLDLLAHGAPAALVEAVQAAMQDEIPNAKDAFAIASALAGRPLAPGPLAIDTGPTPSLAELAASTARDGGIGESVAAAIAAARLSVATDRHVRSVLARIVDDEARHASLAWRIVDSERLQKLIG